MTQGPSIVRLPNADAIAEEAARRFVDSAREAVRRRGRFVVALSGGSTPRRLHALLTRPPYRTEVEWDRVTILFGDERCVPPEHEDSNYRMAKETLLDRLPIPAWRIHRMRGETEPASAAKEYEQRLQALFADDAGDPGHSVPRIDLVLLGMGSDGHTASLFPETAALCETRAWVLANYVTSMKTWRLTMTYPCLNAARDVVFMIAGASKAPVFAEAFGGQPHAAPYPVERVAPTDGSLVILADEAAAGA